MSKKYGVVIASHVEQLAAGVYTLLKEAAPDTSITFSGGTEDGRIGSSFDKILEAVNQNEAEYLYAFYDLGSAKMTLELVSEMTEKKIEIIDSAFIEGAYTASALIQSDNTKKSIDDQLRPLVIK